MKFSMRLLKVVGLNIAIIAASAALYQNCSKVQVDDLSSQSAAVTQSNPAIPSQYAKVTVGISELADLKMLFVVDNSYTMKQNNINLANSFQTLFNAQNSDNLTMFPVTSYLLTVGQKVPAATLTDQTRLEALRTWEIPVSGLTSTQLSAGRTASQLGKIAGDSVGYSVTKTGNSYTFDPATVLGVDATGTVVNSISKGKSEPATALVQDFQNRMTLLQNMSTANYETNKDILDNESGLCAVARMLRSSSYVKAGDLAVLNIFTDENDNDVAGKNCLAGYTYSQGTDDLVDGGCETHRTTFNYKVNTNVPAQCVMNYNNTFNWQLGYTAKQWSSSLQYYHIDSYNCSQTSLSYATVTAWNKKHTNVILTYNSYEVLDGVKVVDPTVRTRSYTVDGYKSSTDCTTIAKSNLNSGSEIYVSNTCSQSLDAVATCSASDANCVIGTQANRTVLLTGDSTAATDCLNAAKSQDANFISGSQSCSLTGNTVNTPWLYVGCSPVISAAPLSASGLTDDLSLQSSCDAKARSMDHGYVDATHPASCTSKQVDVSKSATGSLNLSDYASVTATGSCPSDVQAKATLTAGISASNVTSCNVTSIPLRSSTVTLTAASCDAQALTYCANTSIKNCVLKSTIAASVNQTPQSLTADENLSCTSLCSDSQTGFCKTNANLASIPVGMTISDYLNQAQKSVVACASSTVALTPDISKFNGKLKSDLANLCPAKSPANPLVPVFARVDKTYKFTGFAPDYVAGNVMDVNGVPQPAVDLPTYVAQRAQEIFGGQKPIVNVFVRTANDPLGDGGSRGVAYEQLGLTMNAQVYSVLSSDYSSALKDLSGVIKSKMLRTFKVPNMDSTHKVIGVIWRPQSGAEQKLDPSLWVQAGASVQIQDSVQLTIGDEIQFEYQ